jgi:arsenate reductase-like glutaredoxin family protein
MISINSNENYANITTNIENAIKQKQIISYWTKIYNVFNTFLNNLTLADKKMILKDKFKDYTNNNEEELFKNLKLEKTPIIILESEMKFGKKHEIKF